MTAPASAAYMRQWRKEAAKFLKAIEAVLAKKSAWHFSSGPTGEGVPVELAHGWRLPGTPEPIAGRIGPRDVAILPGAVDADELNSCTDECSRTYKLLLATTVIGKP